MEASAREDDYTLVPTYYITISLYIKYFIIIHVQERRFGVAQGAARVHDRPGAVYSTFLIIFYFCIINIVVMKLYCILVMLSLCLPRSGSWPRTHRHCSNYMI